MLFAIAKEHYDINHTIATLSSYFANMPCISQNKISFFSMSISFMLSRDIKCLKALNVKRPFLNEFRYMCAEYTWQGNT